MKHPTSDIQEPEKIHSSGSKQLASIYSNYWPELRHVKGKQFAREALGAWHLDLFWSLELEAWSLLPHSESRITHHFSRL